jgi:hypothetical protein
MSMLHVNVHAACPCPCLCVNVHAACSSQCCMFTSLQKGHGHSAWTWIFSVDLDMYSSMDTDMQHGNGHAVWTWTCSMGKYMLLIYDYVHVACPCPYCVSQYILCAMSMLHAHVFAGCPCPCCMSISVLHCLEPAAGA